MRSRKSFAGNRGENVRSDCHVQIDWKPRKGLDLVIESKVASLYGTSIRKLLKDLCAHFGISTARVFLDDKGALPYVIAARLETAVRRAGVCPKPFFPFPRANRRPSSRERSRRSRLYLPGNEPKFFINAALHSPDCVILDLEDSVSPEEKDAARILVRNALRVCDFGKCEVSVRINQGELGAADVKAIAGQKVHAIYIPKVESAQDVRLVDELLDENEKNGDQKWHTFIIPIVESALGVVKAYEITTASKRICALAIGLEDYTADLGVPRTLEGKESLFARSAIVNAARAAGIQALDSVFSDISDMDGLARSTRESRALGFDGKGCVHPRQIRVVHEAFLPSDEEIRNAAAIVLAFECARTAGKGVVAVGSKMIDPPVVKRALGVIQTALASGQIKQNWRRRNASQSVDHTPKAENPEI